MSRRMCLFVTVVGTLTAGFTAASATGGVASAAQCRPSIASLGDPFGGHFSYADAINADGAIAGTAMLPDGRGRAVLWTGGRAENLGVVPPYDESFAHALGPGNTVVGELDQKQTKVAPFVYDHGQMRILPGLGGDFGFADGINVHGVISGTASDKQGRSHAVTWTNDGRTVHDLGIAKGDAASFGNGLNDGNVVVGDTDDAKQNERPAVFDHGIRVLRAARGSRFGSVEDLNDSGRAVGITFLSGDREDATVWDAFGANPSDLGRLPGGNLAALESVDDAGRAVGGGTYANSSTTHAIVWPGHGPLLALQPLSGHFRQDFAVARKIGLNGEVVGASLNSAGEIRATVWTCAFAQAFRPQASNQETDLARPSAVVGRDLSWLIPAQVRNPNASSSNRRS